MNMHQHLLLAAIWSILSTINSVFGTGIVLDSSVYCHYNLLQFHLNKNDPYIKRFYPYKGRPWENPYQSFLVQPDNRRARKDVNCTESPPVDGRSDDFQLEFKFRQCDIHPTKIYDAPGNPIADYLVVHLMGNWIKNESNTLVQPPAYFWISCSLPLQAEKSTNGSVNGAGGNSNHGLAPFDGNINMFLTPQSNQSRILDSGSAVAYKTPLSLHMELSPNGSVYTELLPVQCHFGQPLSDKDPFPFIVDECPLEESFETSVLQQIGMYEKTTTSMDRKHVATEHAYRLNFTAFSLTGGKAAMLITCTFHLCFQNASQLCRNKCWDKNTPSNFHTLALEDGSFRRVRASLSLGDLATYDSSERSAQTGFRIWNNETQIDSIDGPVLDYILYGFLVLLLLFLLGGLCCCCLFMLERLAFRKRSRSRHSSCSHGQQPAPQPYPLMLPFGGLPFGGIAPYGMAPYGPFGAQPLAMGGAYPIQPPAAVPREVGEDFRPVKRPEWAKAPSEAGLDTTDYSSPPSTGLSRSYLSQM